MKNILILAFVLIGGEVFAQTKPVVPDTIVRMGGRKVLGIVRQTTFSSVYYTIPSRPDSVIELSRKEIEKVIRKDGRIDVYNKPVLQVVRDDQWQSILITRNKKEVEGMYNRGFFSASSSRNLRSKKKAMESATVKLQKQAVQKKAYIVLITNEYSTGGYSDPPGYYMEGIAYGMEPLEKGTDVVDKKDTK